MSTIVDHAEAYVNNTKVKDRVTSEDMEPDEKFLQSIEEQIGIKGSAKNNFRADITSYMFAKLRRNETIDWRSYGPLREAIESKLVASVRDISRIVTKSTPSNKRNLVRWYRHLSMITVITKTLPRKY